MVAAPGWQRFDDDAETPAFSEPYLLSVGGLTPRKGYDVLARAVAQLGNDCPAVTVVGPDWWRADEVRAEVNTIANGKVQFAGAVSDAALAGLYRGATAFVFPSRAEGFGMPVLEAMGHGLPVVASNLASLREITAGSAVLVPPDDADALAHGIRRALGADAAELGAAAAVRAAHYSWQQMADNVVSAYHLAVHPTR